MACKRVTVLPASGRNSSAKSIDVVFADLKVYASGAGSLPWPSQGDASSRKATLDPLTGNFLDMDNTRGRYTALVERFRKAHADRMSTGLSESQSDGQALVIKPQRQRACRPA